MQDVADHIANFLQSFPPGTFPLIAAALGLAAFQQKVHHWLSVQSPRKKQGITVALSVLTVAIPHALGLLAGNKTLLGAYTTLVISGMTIFYNLLLRETPKLKEDLRIDPPAPIVEPTPDAVIDEPEPNEFR